MGSTAPQALGKKRAQTDTAAVIGQVARVMSLWSDRQIYSVLRLLSAHLHREQQVARRHILGYLEINLI